MSHPVGFRTLLFTTQLIQTTVVTYLTWQITGKNWKQFTMAIFRKKRWRHKVFVCVAYNATKLIQFECICILVFTYATTLNHKIWRDMHQCRPLVMSHPLEIKPFQNNWQTPKTSQGIQLITTYYQMVVISDSKYNPT